jgi:hypothetical protein
MTVRGNPNQMRADGERLQSREDDRRRCGSDARWAQEMREHLDASAPHARVGRPLGNARRSVVAVQ